MTTNNCQPHSALSDEQIAQAKKKIIDVVEPWLGPTALLRVAETVDDLIALLQRGSPRKTAFTRCGLCNTWNSKPCGEQCGWDPNDAERLDL